MSSGSAARFRTKLGQMGKALIGLTYTPEDVAPFGSLVLRSSNIQDGRLTLNDNVFVTCPVPARIRVREGDILICVRNGSRRLIGKSVVLDGRVTGQTFGAFMAVFRSPLNEFLTYYFQSNDFKRQVDEHLGATINQITNGSLKGFEVNLPGPDERAAIIGCLADADRLVELLESLILKKVSMRQGMLQRLLSGKTRLPGFVEDWKLVKLGQLGGFSKGRGIRREDVRSFGTACIRYGEIYTRFTDYTATPASYVSEAVTATASPLRSGDLLFAASGETREEIGKCVAYVGDQPAVAGGDIVILRGAGFNPIFLASLMNMPSVVAQKARLGQGDAVVHISSRALADVEVSVPHRAEQDAIAEVLLDTRSEIDALYRRLGKVKNLRRGMMQELLSGNARPHAYEAPNLMGELAR